MEKVKVLEVTSSLNIGGAETLLMNILANINKEKFSIDFLCYGNDKFAYEEKVKKYGSSIFRINNPIDIGMIRHIKEVYSFLKKNNYNVVHCHNLFNCGPVLFAAFLAGVKIRIAHSHTTVYLNDGPISLKKKVYYFLAKRLISLFATKRFACGIESGKFLYGNKKFKVIKNGINTNDYIFSKTYRDMIRKKYNIDDSTVVLGHVGRFVEVKNHLFLIDVFKDYCSTNDSKLLLVGDGILKDEIVNKIKQYKLEEKVILTGAISDVNKYYSAMDCFVFPSLSEGLPLTLIEAQTNGLPIIASDGISVESDITNTICFEKLNSKKWLVDLNEIDKVKRNDNLNKVIESGFDINDTTKLLEKEYSF